MSGGIEHTISIVVPVSGANTRVALVNEIRPLTESIATRRGVASSSNASRQPLDLRMRSVVWPEINEGPKTTRSEGI
jgi:hypothetical protein